MKMLVHLRKMEVYNDKFEGDPNSKKKMLPQDDDPITKNLLHDYN